MNMLRRAQGRFEDGREIAVAGLRRARVVGSDETGVRIEGSNAYHWVFRCAEVVVRDMMGGHRPEVWCSDRYVAQQGHADAHQTCLAHLARDVAYAIEAGDDVLPMRLKLWLHKAFGLARDIEALAVSTIAARRRALERTLQDILDTPTSCDLARVVQNKFRRARDQLLTFALWPGQVEATNNRCWARALAGVDLVAARADCDAGLRLRPGVASVLDSRAMVGLKQNRFQDAWNDYDAAARTDPGSAHYLYGRGIAALRLGRTTEGQADLARATRLDANIAQTYAGYGITP